MLARWKMGEEEKILSLAYMSHAINNRRSCPSRVLVRHYVTANIWPLAYDSEVVLGSMRIVRVCRRNHWEIGLDAYSASDGRIIVTSAYLCGNVLCEGKSSGLNIVTQRLSLCCSPVDVLHKV